MEKKFGSLSSSVDGQKLATTVKGAIVAATTAIIWGAMYLTGVELDGNDVNELATSAGSIISAYFVIYGLIQKLVAGYASRE